MRVKKAGTSHLLMGLVVLTVMLLGRPWLAFAPGPAGALPLVPGPILNVWNDAGIENIPLETYVARVVAAEMPAAYALEALKAQAVAARTRALSPERCARHAEADICTDSTCCQAYLAEAGQRARWGDDYDDYHAKVVQAAQDTRGLILTYEEEPILVLYHAVSGGHTEDVEMVYSQALPYLRGVESPGEESASRYETEQTFTRAVFAQKINGAYPKAKLEADILEEQVEILSRSDSDRVLAVRLGGVQIDGRALRKVLGLYSAIFTIEWTDQEVLIAQRGYGHGVGMSQAGAQAMALAGYDYQAILTHYYTGVEIISYRAAG